MQRRNFRFNTFFLWKVLLLNPIHSKYTDSTLLVSSLGTYASEMNPALFLCRKMQNQRSNLQRNLGYVLNVADI